MRRHCAAGFDVGKLVCGTIDGGSKSPGTRSNVGSGARNSSGSGWRGGQGSETTTVFVGNAQPASKLVKRNAIRIRYPFRDSLRFLQLARRAHHVHGMRGGDLLPELNSLFLLSLKAVNKAQPVGCRAKRSQTGQHPGRRESLDVVAGDHDHPLSRFIG